MSHSRHLLESLARDLESEFAGSTAELSTFPSGGAMLDVRRGDGHVFVLSFLPHHGFGVDEVDARDGWTTGYQFVFSEFEPAARKLRSLLTGEVNSKNGRPAALNLLVIYTGDLQAAAKFYTAIGLDLKREKHGRGPEHLAAHLAGTVVELYPCPAGGVRGGSRIGFRIPALDTALDALRQQLAKVLKEPHNSPWGRRAVVEDFDGNQIELTEAG